MCIVDDRNDVYSYLGLLAHFQYACWVGSSILLIHGTSTVYPGTRALALNRTARFHYIRPPVDIFMRFPYQVPGYRPFQRSSVQRSSIILRVIYRS